MLKVKLQNSRKNDRANVFSNIDVGFKKTYFITIYIYILNIIQ